MAALRAVTGAITAARTLRARPAMATRVARVGARPPASLDSTSAGSLGRVIARPLPGPIRPLAASPAHDAASRRFHPQATTPTRYPPASRTLTRSRCVFPSPRPGGHPSIPSLARALASALAHLTSSTPPPPNTGHPRARQARHARVLERGSARILGPGLRRRRPRPRHPARLRAPHRVRSLRASPRSARPSRPRRARVVARSRPGTGSHHAHFRHPPRGGGGAHGSAEESARGEPSRRLAPSQSRLDRRVFPRYHAVPAPRVASRGTGEQHGGAGDLGGGAGGDGGRQGTPRVRRRVSFRARGGGKRSRRVGQGIRGGGDGDRNRRRGWWSWGTVSVARSPRCAPRG